MESLGEMWRAPKTVVSCDRKLVGERTAKSRLSEMRVTETQFADDAELYATTSGALESAAAGYDEVADNFGLLLSVEKTKEIVVGNEMDVASVQVKGCNLDIVDQFQYQGSNISRDGEVAVEIDRRIAKASQAFGCLRKTIFLDKNLSIATKRQKHKAPVLSALLY